jgi:hypothetical protein
VLELLTRSLASSEWSGIPLIGPCGSGRFRGPIGGGSLIGPFTSLVKCPVGRSLSGRAVKGMTVGDRSRKPGEPAFDYFGRQALSRNLFRSTRVTVIVGGPVTAAKSSGQKGALMAGRFCSILRVEVADTPDRQDWIDRGTGKHAVFSSGGIRKWSRMVTENWRNRTQSVRFSEPGPSLIARRPGSWIAAETAANNL